MRVSESRKQIRKRSGHLRFTSSESEKKKLALLMERLNDNVDST